MSRLLAYPGTRRGKFVVVAVWLLAIAGVMGFQLPAKFMNAERNENSSFLPEDAESTKA